MFGAGAASHDFQSSCDPSTSVPFGAQLMSLMFVKIYVSSVFSLALMQHLMHFGLKPIFFGPALEAAKFGTF